MTNALDREMVRRAADQEWQLAGLRARGPVPSLRRRLRLFGQFVGDWKIHEPGSPRAAPDERSSGEVRFRWVLGGTAVQDIWGPFDSDTGKLVPEGTTLRFYDPSIRAWRSTWISPYQRVVRRFIGREEAGEIVLREQDAGWKGENWIFSDISHASFRWRAETRASPHARPRVTEEYLIRRT